MSVLSHGTFGCMSESVNTQVYMGVRERTSLCDRDPQTDGAPVSLNKQMWRMRLNVKNQSFSISHLEDGVGLRQEWLINLSSPHLDHMRHSCLYPHIYTCHVPGVQTLMVLVVWCLTPSSTSTTTVPCEV